MESSVSTRKRAAAAEALSEINTQMANGAESLEDLRECERTGSKKNGTSTPIGSSETIIECESSAETEDYIATAGLILPPEVVIEILCWLPLRSLGKLQLVCKEWRGFIRGRYLIERNMDRREVICHWVNSVKPGDHAKPDQNGDCHMFLDGIDGMLLIRNCRTKKFTIWNPATHGVLRLPDQQKDSLRVTFNYVKSTGNYLLVSVFNDESGRESCQVFTPGQSWRRLAFPDVVEAKGHRERQRFCVVSSGGAVHTVLIIKVGSTVTRKVVSLDLETECFTVTCFVQTKFKNLKRLWAVDWNGKLALATLDGTNLHVMELEDYKKQRWCQQNKVIPLPFLGQGNDDASGLVPLFVKNGDLWFRFGESRVLIYTIETGHSTHINSVWLSPTGKLYPYKPTLVGLQGMQQDADFGKRWFSLMDWS